jgi:hypothetical protein
MMAEKRIHTRSFPNVETERLLARLEYMRVNLARLGSECEQKNDFRAHAREVINCERELLFRQVPFVPVTNGAHLLIPLDHVRLVQPEQGSGIFARRIKAMKAQPKLEG